MKYLRRELNQVEKEYVKQFGEDSLNRVILHDPDTKDKQEVQDTIDILKEAIAKNKPLEQVQRICGSLLSFNVYEFHTIKRHIVLCADHL